MSIMRVLRPKEVLEWGDADTVRYAICYECPCGYHTTRHERPNYHSDSVCFLTDEQPDYGTCPDCQKPTLRLILLERNGFYVAGYPIGDKYDLHT